MRHPWVFYEVIVTSWKHWPAERKARHVSWRARLLDIWGCAETGKVLCAIVQWDCFGDIVASFKAITRFRRTFTRYMGKPEIPVGKSNGCDLWWCNFSTTFACSADLNILCSGWFSRHVKFHSFMFMSRFPPGRFLKMVSTFEHKCVPKSSLQHNIDPVSKATSKLLILYLSFNVESYLTDTSVLRTPFLTYIPHVKQSLYLTLVEHVVARLSVTQTLLSVDEIPWRYQT